MLQKMRKHIRSRSAPWLITETLVGCALLVLTVGTPEDPREWRQAVIVFAALVLVALLAYWSLRHRGVFEREWDGADPPAGQDPT